MSLVPSLLQAILRVDGEALVMHAGDKPYVVSPTGQVELASRGLTLDAINTIVGQLLPTELQAALDEFGAVQYELPAADEFPDEHFTVVAARGGDDVWTEIRRRRMRDDDQVPEELFGPSRSAPVAAPQVLSLPAAAPAPAFARSGDDDLSLSAETPGFIGATERTPEKGDVLLLADGTRLWPEQPRSVGVEAGSPERLALRETDGARRLRADGASASLVEARSDRGRVEAGGAQPSEGEFDIEIDIDVDADEALEPTPPAPQPVQPPPPLPPVVEVRPPASPPQPIADLRPPPPAPPLPPVGEVRPPPTPPLLIADLRPPSPAPVQAVADLRSPWSELPHPVADVRPSPPPVADLRPPLPEPPPPVADLRPPAPVAPLPIATAEAPPAVIEQPAEASMAPPRPAQPRAVPPLQPAGLLPSPRHTC